MTIPRAVWEQLLRDVEELKRARATRGAAPSSAPGTAPGDDETPQPIDDGTTGGTGGTSGNGTASDGSGSGSPGGGGGGRSLLLPDISFIAQAKGALSSDRRDESRSSLRLSEGELGIQGYVYPGVKVDAFITGSPVEDEPFQLEEGYLSFLGVRKGVNLFVGRKFAPFGRTGEQHPHSWLYARQLLPRQNLISEEALSGDGLNARFVLPTRGNLFAQLDLGIFNGGEPGTISGAPFSDSIARGPGAGFTSRFYNTRLYLAHPLGKDGEISLGGSYARGTSTLEDDDENELGTGRVAVSGLDLSFRRYYENSKRLLLRAEYFGYRPGRGAPTNRASGYYGIANYRFDPRKDIGLMYERSGFPQLPGQHENALSLIYTKQFTEQFYMRLQGTRGRRPGEGSYSELGLQFVFGLGPHSHNVE